MNKTTKEQKAKETALRDMRNEARKQGKKYRNLLNIEDEILSYAKFRLWTELRISP